MGEDWDSWASITRSCVLTSKKPLTPLEINRDTKMLEGRDIPFRQFNCRTLEDMLRKIDGLKVFQMQGRTYVQAIPSEETAHISRFIKLQKSSKKKPRTLLTPNNRYPLANRRPPFNRTPPMNRNNAPQNRFNTQYNNTQYNNTQNKYNVPNNRPTSAEPPKRPTPSAANASFQINHEQPKRIPPLLSTPPLLPTPPLIPISPLLPTPPSTPGSQKKNVHFTPGPIQQRLAPKSDDPRLILNSYTEARKLPLPVYKDLPMKNNYIYSSVTVDSKKYSSYPKEAKTKEEAEKLAAQAALEELLKDRKPKVVTSNTNLLKKRILEIVNDHPNGLIEAGVVDTYIVKYGEGLPKDWLKLVENCITIDIGANNLTILSPQNDEVRLSSPLSPAAIVEPEVLKLNNLEEFWLHIYVLYNTTDIWGVIIDENHSDKIDELAKEMKTYYDNNTNTKAPTVIPGKYYTVFDSEWHRVRCIKVEPDNENATIFFIDRGDEDVFPISRLHVLEPKFCQLPAQSVRLSMAGFEVFEDCEETQPLLEELLVDKDVYVRSLRYDQRYTEEKYSATVTAELYLERDGKEVNANELLRNEIFKKVVNPIVYIGPEKVAQEVYISYISETAIYVQLKTKGLKYLDTLLRDIAKENHKPILKFDTTKTYVIKHDNKWCRVKIIKIENENEAQVLYIDIGNTMSVNRSSLVLLEDLSDILALYPPQALQVRLHKISPITFDKKMAAHLRALAPKTDVFYMKVVGNMQDIPMVEFYKRTEDNYLASLNDTLALEPEIISKDDNNNAKPRIRNDRSSIGGSRSEFPLKAPCIPAIGSYFDVYITMAAHPGNFTVQPLITVHELEELMNKLSQVCETYKGPALTSSCVKVGNMYAAKYDDGKWYRAYVSKVISKNVCAVYFCDYGDYRAVSLEHLQPLQNQFYDLPYQAIKAKLYGVTPKLKGDWTVKDSLRFNELIVSKSFVSVIKSCDVENITTGETILGLELIDTSTLEDIYITNILVDEKRADKLDELKV